MRKHRRKMTKAEQGMIFPNDVRTLPCDEEMISFVAREGLYLFVCHEEGFMPTIAPNRVE